MRVSVVCSVRNEEKNIKKLIECLLNQDYKPLEIIFIDDDSEDKTPEIIKTYMKKNRIIKIFSTKNHNISKNRNFGILKSRGEFIMIIDGGCFIKKSYLSSLINCQRRHRDKEFLGGITKIPYSNDFERCYSLLLERPPLQSYLPKGHEFFFSKRLWEKIRGFNEDLETAEDTEFIARASRLNQAPYICPNAIVYWSPRKKLSEVRSQFYKYGQGDRKAFGFRELPRNSKMSIIALAFFPILLLHALGISIKFLLKTHKIKSFFIAFLLDLTKVSYYSMGVLRGPNRILI